MRSVLFFLALAVPALAVQTRAFEFSEFRQWESARLEGVKVSSTGELSLGLDARPVETGEKEVWASLVAKDGKVWFTTGNGAVVYRLDGDKATPVFKAEEVAFSCLAEGPDGRMYAGSLPAGRIYAIDAKGEGKVFTTLPAPYVWNLVFDRENHLLAGTGPEGVIYRISPNGEAKIHYDARDGNILALAFAPDGELYAGSAGKGLVYRIRQPGDAQVVWDFHGREVKALAFHGTRLFAAVNDGGGRSATPGGKEAGRTALEFSNLARKLSQKFEGAEVSQEGAELSSDSSLLKKYEAAGAATLEEIHVEGRVETLWELPDSSILDLKAGADGLLYVATAKSGRVYAVEPKGPSYLLLTAEDAQAVTLAMDRGVLAFVGHANPGTAVAIAKSPPASGQLTTKALDAGFPSRFGQARWDGAGDVKLATRSGQTGKPDHTWSAWGEAVPPPGRYLQARIALTGAAARVANLALFYLNQNQSPHVESVTFGAKTADPDETSKPDARSTELKKMTEVMAALAGKPSKDEPEKGSKARPTPAPAARGSPVKEVRWDAEDRDGDALVYRLYFRGQGEPDWVPLTPRAPLEEPQWSWPTDQVPDGRYVLKVVASDERANPAGEGLTGEKSTLPFVIDNTRPTITVREASAGRLEIAVKDASSPVTKAELSIDGQEWTPLHPRDRIADGLEEQFDAALPALPAGPHAVAVRATDAQGNVGAARLFVRGR